MDAAGAECQFGRVAAAPGGQIRDIPHFFGDGRGCWTRFCTGFQLLQSLPEQPQALPSDQVRHTVVTSKPDFCF
jgi:hypothetical protein